MKKHKSRDIKNAKAVEQKISWSLEDNESLEKFLSCPADEVLYGGAAGCAKTEGLIIESITGGSGGENLFTNGNWKCLFLRRTFPELENSAILRSQELLHDRAKYDAQKHRWTSPVGGIIQYGHIKNDTDLVKHHSAEYTKICYDELTTFTERMYLYLFSRLRSRDEKIKPCIRAGTNPIGFGLGFVKKRFITDKEKYKIYHESLKLPNGVITDWSRCFIPANVFDNKYLMKTDPLYARRLYELPEVERRALLHGDWDAFSGQFFPEFSEDHLIDDFEIPSDWPIWISLDWGMQTRCGVLFFAEDPETGVIYLFDEIYVKMMKVDQVSDLIKSKLGDHFVYLRGRYSDKRIMVKNEDTNVSTQEKFAFSGLYFTPVDTNRIAGWHRARELLSPTLQGELKFCVMRKCVNFIRTMLEMIFDAKNPDDMYHRGETHLPDALRYFAIARKSNINDEVSAIPFSEITGYVGIREHEIPLRYKIKRLPGLVRGKNYFLDRPEPSKNFIEMANG